MVCKDVLQNNIVDATGQQMGLQTDHKLYVEGNLSTWGLLYYCLLLYSLEILHNKKFIRSLPYSVNLSPHPGFSLT